MNERISGEMKVAELKKGMLLEACLGAYFHLNTTFLSDVGERILTARWGKRISDDIIPTIMYLGTREDLNLKQNYWGKQYALVEGDITLIDSSSWLYIQPVKEKKHGNSV